MYLMLSIMDLSEANMKYRELVLVLWHMIHSYVNVSITNIDTVLELFETSVRIAHELTELAPEGEGVVLSQYLNEIVHGIVPEVRTHLQNLTHDILHGLQINVHTLPTNNPVQVVQNQQASPAGNDSRDEARKNEVTAMKEYPSGEGLQGVAGMKEAKCIIRQSVVLPVKFPQLFTGGRRPWGSIFLYGPPGTGKTRLAHAVAAEIGAAFYSVSSSTLLSAWFGESEKMVREIFDHVRASKERCVVFIDEIDGICRKRASNDGESSRRLKAELLSQMQDLPRSTFLVAATNCPWDVDPAFMRRFQRRVYIPLPERDARLEIILTAVDSCKTTLTLKDWDRVTELTEGYSGSDLTCVTQCALMMPVKELDDATCWVIREADGMWLPVDADHHRGPRIHSLLANVPADRVTSRDVELRDFQAAVGNTSKTVSDDDIKSYLEFNAKYA